MTLIVCILLAIFAFVMMMIAVMIWLAAHRVLTEAHRMARPRRVDWEGRR